MFSNTKEKIIAFIKENKWIILVSLFFIGWKFFLVSVFFNNEFSRSEEALIYTGYIDSTNQCSLVVFCKEFLLSFANYAGFAHLSYRLFFGFIGHLLKMKSFDVFHLSFYIGIIALVPALIMFLKNIEKNKKLIAFLLFFLALYNGGGSHGFWWVVPDFFASLLAFIAFAIILGNYKHWKILLAILVPVGFYAHTIFVYLMMTIAFFYLIYSLFVKKMDSLMLKKIAFSFFILAIFYIPTSYYLGGNPYGPETFITNSNIIASGTQMLEKKSLSPTINSSFSIKGNYQLKQLFPGFHKIKDRYFNWIFFNPITPVFNWTFNPFYAVSIMIFVYVLFIVFYYKQYKILSLYLASLAFTLISSINVHADRALPLIWPMTFILYAYGAWYSFTLADEIFKNTAINRTTKALLCFGIIVFIIINLIYSYGMNQSIYFNPQEFLNNYVRNIW